MLPELLANKCPYCSNRLVETNEPYLKIYSCVNCNETFELHYRPSNAISFMVFSINDLIVRQYFIEVKFSGKKDNVFYVRNKTSFSSISPNTIIKLFYIDFLPKEIIYNKFKTYMLFL